ncbi:OmpP1/FadL family transporter [Gracilimonas halophila]|uniref:OmpP1/FadL family transporter n=1 Tax=Gracilimonas halophila TaxID=1834464 RepID=A0ABW5JNL6_9BACT
MKRITLFLLTAFLLTFEAVYGQDGNSQVSYSNLALQFSEQNYNGDPATGYFPSVANLNGFGSFLANPATIGLIEDNYFSFGLVNQSVERENTYLGNSLITEDNFTNLSNIGFIYKAPTEQGSFVIGAGYNSVSDQKGITRLSARNNESTITDQFKDPSSDYNDIAFNAYAIDWGDVNETYLESIFRIGFAEYPGITQEAEVSYETNLGEYSFFFGTEFQKDLFIGISGGLTAGNYTYRRDFLEVDDQNDYNFNFIPSDVEGDSTDIDNILTHDEIDAEIYGFTLRTGLLYKLTPNLNIGLSYLIPSTLVVNEEYYSSITTELDDGSTPFESDFASEEDYEYRIKKPGQLSAGLALVDIAGFDVSISGEMIDYSNLGLDLIKGNDFNFNDEVAIREQEEELEDFMANNYKRVINYKAGIGYQVTNELKLKGGYAFFEGKSRIFEADREIYSAGISAKIAENITLDLNGQYSMWNDRSVAYSYLDFDTNETRAEVIDQDVSLLRIMAGIRFNF